MPNTHLARTLRKKPTWAEKLVWRWLRDRRFTGYNFRRQHPTGEYVLDFFCEEARLSIELDGFQHGHPVRQAYDTKRAQFLETSRHQGIAFLELSIAPRGPDTVRDAIFKALQQRAPHPLPAYTRPGIVGVTKSRKEARQESVVLPGKSQGEARPHPGPLPRGEGELPGAV